MEKLLKIYPFLDWSFFVDAGRVLFINEKTLKAFQTPCIGGYTTVSEVKKL